MVDVSALSRQRVKVYQLSDDGQWDDKGTGHIYYQMDEQVFSFSVRSEENNSVLLEHKIEATIDYQRQGDSIIMWSEPDGHDTALSFLDFYACNSLWEHITSAQTGKNDDLLSRANDENSPPTEEAANDATRGPLPPPDVNNLETIFSKITAANKDHIIRAIQQNYIQQLLDVFTEIEDGEQKELLSIMFYIFNAIIALNEMPIIEILFSEENFFRILGPLEYDPDLPASATHRQHREFLKNAVFKQVVTIKDPTVLNKIHQNYRYTYIKDVVLLRYLDDPTLSTMNSLIYYNNLAIMTYIADTPEVLSELFAKLKTFAPFTMQRPQGKDAKPAAPSQAEYETQRKEVWNFVKEIFLIAKTMELKFKASFFRALVNQGLLRLMETALASASADQQNWLWIACTEAVSTITCHHDPELIRTHFLNRAGPESLLGLLVQTAVSDSMSSGIAHQLVEVLKILLDVETMQASLKDKFMDIFYSQHIGTIVKALTRPLLPMHLEPTAISTPKFHAVELLTHCIVKHGYRCKHYITRHNVLSKVADLVTTGSRELALSCIRCIRATVGLKDEQFNRHIAQQQLLDPIIALFLKNGARYNMVNSAVIELCEFIIRDPQKDLLESLLSRHWPKLEHITYVDTFKRLKERFDELEKGAHASDADSDTPTTSPRPGSNGVSPASDRWRAPRKDDDDSYFNEGADDEHDHSGEGGEASRPPATLTSPTAAGGSSPVSPTAAGVGVGSPTSARVGQSRSPRAGSPPLSASPGSPPAVFSKSPLSPPAVSLSSPTSPRNKDNKSPLSPPGRIASSSPPAARPTGGSSPKSVEGLTLDSDGFLDRRELESRKDNSEPDFMSALSQKNSGKGAGSGQLASAVLAGSNKGKARLPIKVQTKPQKLSVNLTAALSKQLSPNSPASPSSPHSPSPTSSPVSAGIKLVDYDDDEEEEEAGDKKSGSTVSATLVSPPSLSHAKSKVGEMPSSDSSPAHNSAGGRENDAESPQTPTKRRKTGAAPEENGSSNSSSPLSNPVTASQSNQ